MALFDWGLPFLAQTPALMKFRAICIFLSAHNVLAQRDRERDGLVVTGPDTAITYHSARWEPLCGTVNSVSGVLERGSTCIPALSRYTNDTTSTLNFYDSSGVKLINAGVGLGKAVCLCFSMSTTAGAAYDICWAYNAIGQFVVDGGGWQVGAYRPGASKSLPQCGEVDVNALQAGWTRTAVMPQETGPIQTLNTGPTTVDHTVTQIRTSTLTPTLVNLTITSSAVTTDPNGQAITVDRSYTTTAAVINFEPTPERGLTPGDKIALGIGLGLGIPTLVLALLGFYYNRRQKAPPVGEAVERGLATMGQMRRQGARPYY